jgi:hypothetical protein
MWDSVIHLRECVNERDVKYGNTLKRMCKWERFEVW